MKKIVRTLCLVAMVALVATSCKKKEENATVTVSFDETKGFEAGPSFDGSKTYLDPNDGYNFKWNNGDQIAFYNLSSTWNESECTVLEAVQGSEGKPKTQFTGEVGEEKDNGYFVFLNPNKAAGAQSGHTQGAGNRETFTVPATQNYESKYLIDHNALVMACKAPSAGVFSLQHIFGFLNVAVGHNINDTRIVTSIVVEDDVRYLAGTVNLKLDEVDTEKLTNMINYLADGNDGAYETEFASYVVSTLGYNATGTSKQITLNCGADTTLTKGKYQYFFIPLRPGALYQGFKVTVNYNGGISSSYHFTGDDVRSFIIKPATFTNIYTVTSGKWYRNNGWVDSNM